MKKSVVKNIGIVALLAIAVIAVVEIRNSKQAAGCCSACTGMECPGMECARSESGAVAEPATKPLPLLLDLGADKCIPCKMMMPILDELKESFPDQLEVRFIDVWKSQDEGAQYGIRSIPTQIFFDADGKELFRHEGFFAREDILAKWKELGFAFEGQE